MGHMVGLRKLRQFQELGHQVVLIVGDWTAQIGDPSGASVTRPMLTAEKVKENAETYMKQFFRVVDREKTEVRWQSEWFGNFSLADVIKLTSKFTVAQFLAREDFNNRFKAGKPIAITDSCTRCCRLTIPWPCRPMLNSADRTRNLISWSGVNCRQ